MSEQQEKLPWNQKDWLEIASAWIHEQIRAHGWQTAGAVEMIHQRPWSAFARIRTDHGVVYFKATAAGSRYEAALTQALAHWFPHCTVPLLAIDPVQGWLLSADAGDTLRSRTRTPDQAAHWLKVLPLYAQLQIEMVDRLPQLLAMSVPDRRLIHLPQLYDQLLEDTENLRVGLQPGLTGAEYQQLRGLRPRFKEMCQELAAYNLPETLAHEEVHENNVIVRAGRYRFTDWSDCCAGHPFFSILVTLRTFIFWMKLDRNGRQIQQLRDRYLEPWTAFATRKQVTAACELAYRIGMVNRALSYQVTMRGLAENDKQAYLDSIPGWLQDFLYGDDR